jgi:hypothetical protein
MQSFLSCLESLPGKIKEHHLSLSSMDVIKATNGLIALTPEIDGDRLTTCHVCSIKNKKIKSWRNVIKMVVSRRYI